MAAAAPQTYISPLTSIFRAWEDGHAAVLVDGRSVYDLDADAQGKLRPLHELLRRECRDRGLLLVTYSLAGGLEWNASALDDRERRAVHELLRTHRLADLAIDQNEVVRVIRGVASLARAASTGVRWTSGGDLHFCFLLEFAEHLTPGSLTNGTQTDGQLVAIELAHITAQSLALRSSGNLVLFHAREGLLDDLVRRVLYRVRLRQPSSEDKQCFLSSALSVYPQARFQDLDAPAVAHLTTNTPNRGLEALLRASQRSGRPVTAADLAAQKCRDVVEISEGTLSVLDTARVEGVELHGATIDTPLRALLACAAGLKRGDRSTPGNVLLAGAPGSGKTDMALLAARAAGVAAYAQLSPKDSLVGSTERRARLQQETLEELTPNISFIDEVTEAFPLQRSDFDGDSGASKAVTAAMLTALSNENRRGRSLLIGTTNCPWRMADAMRSRFQVIPVLHPAAPDYPGIVLATARRTAPQSAFDLQDDHIQEAARIFYTKGANPRHMRSALSSAMLENGKLTSDLILTAAHDLRTGSDRISAIYADLWAIRLTSKISYLPWSVDPKNFPYPPHLQGVVNPSTGEVDEAELDKRIAELQPQANV
jgi:hypothetical protein